MNTTFNIWILLILTNLICIDMNFAQSKIPEVILKQAQQYLVPLPNQLKIAGSIYSFDQQFLESNLGYMLNNASQRAEKLGNLKDSRIIDAAQLQTSLAAIAYCVIAAGHFAEPTENLSSLLSRTKLLVGHLLVPDGITWPEDHFFGAAAMSFKDDQDASLDTTGILGKHGTYFTDLIYMSIVKTAARNSKP